jgi:hypothetical protein
MAKEGREELEKPSIRRGEGRQLQKEAGVWREKKKKRKASFNEEGETRRKKD